MVRTQECLPLGNHSPKAPPGPAHGADQRHASAGAAAAPPACCATCLALVPGEGQQLLVGTAAGAVLRGARIGRPPPPRVYAPRELRPSLVQQALNGGEPGGGGWGGGSRVAGDAGAGGAGGAGGACGGAAACGSAVTCLDVSPFCAEAFLSGHGDGCMALHSLGWSGAARVWAAAGAGPLVSVRWAGTVARDRFEMRMLCAVELCMQYIGVVQTAV